MKFRMRNRIPLGPFRLNFSQGRYTSTSFQIGRLSYNFSARKWSFDTPGPGHIVGGGRTWPGRRT